MCSKHLIFVLCFRFKQHINSNPIAAVLCTEELLKLRAEVAAAPPGLTSAEAEPLITVASPSSNPPGKCVQYHTKESYHLSLPEWKQFL